MYDYGLVFSSILWVGIVGLGSSDSYGVNRSLPALQCQPFLIIIRTIYGESREFFMANQACEIKHMNPEEWFMVNQEKWFIVINILRISQFPHGWGCKFLFIKSLLTICMLLSWIFIMTPGNIIIQHLQRNIRKFNSMKNVTLMSVLPGDIILLLYFI